MFFFGVVVVVVVVVFTAVQFWANARDTEKK
jgi:hypothetical protein